MAAGAIVGALKYLVEVDAERAALEVDKFLAEAEAKMRAAGGEATFRLLADKAELEAAIAEAETQLAKLKRQKAEVKIGADTSALDAKIVETEGQVKALDKQRATIEVQVRGAARAMAELEAIKSIKSDLTESTIRDTAATDRNALAVARLRENYNRLASERLKLERIKPAIRRTEGENLAIARMAAQMRVMESDARRLGTDLSDITKDVEGADNGFRNWARSIGSTRANIGPFSTTIRGLMTILPALTPILFSLAGAASAAIGSIGAGLVGAFGLASGAAAGFGITLLGILPSMKALFKEAKTAPSVAGPLKAMRDSLTGGLRHNFFKDAHQSIQTLQKDFPMFQHNADRAFKTASAGWQQWMKGLRSPEARTILSSLMTNFRKDLGPTMAGLGSLATAFGRFISIASGSGPGIAHTFQSWAQSIEQGTRAGTGFGARVQSLISQAKTLGSAIMATGRLLTAFFSAGASSGQDLLQSLTRSENRMTAWMHTVAGQKSLHQFFQDAVANTKQLFAALAPLVSTFTHLGNALAPVTSGVLEALTAIGKLVHTVASVVPGRISLQFFGIAVGLGLVATRASAAVNGLKSLGAILGLTTAEQSAETAAMEANTAALEANTAARLGLGAAAGEEAAGLGAAAVAEEGATAGMIGMTTAASSLVVPIAGVAAGGLLLAHLFHGPVPAAVNHANSAFDAATTAIDGARQATSDLHKAQQASQSSWKTANKLAAQGKTNTDAFKQSVEAGVRADQQERQARQRQVQQTQEYQKQLANLKQSYKDLTSEQRASQTLAAGRGQAAGGGVTKATGQELQAINTQIQTTEINIARLKAGLGTIGPQFAAAIGHIRSLAGSKIATKLQFSGSTQAVQEIDRLSQSLQRLHRGRQAIRILADTGSAESKVLRLRNLLDNTKQARAAKVTADVTGAIHGVAQFLGLAKQTDKSHTTKVTADTSQAQAALSAVLGIMHTIGQGVTGFVHLVTGHGHAAGGIENPQMQRAYKRAAMASGINPRAGARVTSPRYVVGEDPGATEFIITDNPQYRRSNRQYLIEAARALGMVIPGYKTGKGKKKKGHGGGGGVGVGSLDNATSADSAYQSLEDLVQYDAGVVDLTKRRYDLNQGPTINDVIGAIGTEISDYQRLASLIDGMIHGPLGQKVAVGPKPKKTKTKAQKRAAALHDAQQAHNAAITSNYENLSDELRTINSLTIPGLILDQLEAQHAANTNTIMGQETANAARYNLFSKFASNIIGGVTAATAQMASPPISAPLAVTQPATTPRATVTSSAQAAPSARSGGITINQTFPTPPADAHVWAQNTVFEITAAGA